MTKKAWEEMSPNLVTIGWNEATEQAFRQMAIRRVRHLPVVDDAGHVIGILSDRDVQRSMISQIDRPSNQPMGDEVIKFDPDSRVRDYMNWPPKAVDQYTDLRVVAERMIAEKISSFLVLREECVIGIVTSEDLLKVLVQLLAESKSSKNWNLSHLFDESSSDLSRTLI